ncbi:hypothetical protein, partial [Aeromonas veronii]|uniref:hypothetical protein n=1 Tax=Aeromonas veronii TaxID=654 RepID=UPI003BA1FC83
GYHQSAVGHLSPFIHECRTYYLNSRIKHLYILGCDFLFFIANKNPGGLILLHSTLYSSLTDPRHLLTV